MDEKSRYTIEYINPEPAIATASPFRSILYFLLGGLAAFFVLVFSFSSLSNTSISKIITSPKEVVKSIGSSGDAINESVAMLSQVQNKLAKAKEENKKLNRILKDNEQALKKNSKKSLAVNSERNEIIQKLTIKVKELEETTKTLSEENKKLNKTASNSLRENKKIALSADSLISESKKSKEQINKLVAEAIQAKRKIISLNSDLAKAQKEKVALELESKNRKQKIDSLLAEKKSVEKKSSNLSHDISSIKVNSERVLSDNKDLRKRLSELSTRLQKEKESNASLLYQLSLQKTENVRLSRVLNKEALSNPNIASAIKKVEVVKIVTEQKTDKKTSDENSSKTQTPSKKVFHEKVNQKQKSNIDDIMAAMGKVDTSPPVSAKTQRKKDFVVEVSSDDNTDKLEKVFQKELDNLTE